MADYDKIRKAKEQKYQMAKEYFRTGLEHTRWLEAQIKEAEKTIALLEKQLENLKRKV